MRRVDIDDVSGTAFCEGCASDAGESGLFGETIELHEGGLVEHVEQVAAPVVEIAEEVLPDVSLDEGGVVAVVHEGEVVTPLDELGEVARSAAEGDVAIIEAGAQAAAEVAEADAAAQAFIIEAQADAAVAVIEAEAAAQTATVEARADAIESTVPEVVEAVAESSEPEAVAEVVEAVADAISPDVAPDQDHWYYRQFGSRRA